MSQFTLKKAERAKVKLRIGISAPSGHGKTYSALLLAKGLVGDWNKIAVIDTEQDSAALYSHLGPFNHLSLGAPFEPERYIEAIETCEKAGMEVIIIDSMTHEWSGAGGMLEYQTRLGGRFTDWAKVTPRHKSFLEKILQSKAHIIGTVRKKTDWVIEDNDKGKKEPRKVGLADEQRQGLEYEWTAAFTLAKGYLASAEKDRTSLFIGKPDFVITEETGRIFADWAQKGIEAVQPASKIYDGSVAMTEAMHKCLGSKNVPKSVWPAIESDMLQKPFVISKLEEIIKAVMDRSNNTNGAEYVL